MPTAIPIVEAIQEAEALGMRLDEYLSIDISNGVPRILAYWLLGYRAAQVSIRSATANKTQQTQTNP